MRDRNHIGDDSPEVIVTSSVKYAKRATGVAKFDDGKKTAQVPNVDDSGMEREKTAKSYKNTQANLVFEPLKAKTW